MNKFLRSLLRIGLDLVEQSERSGRALRRQEGHTVRNVISFTAGIAVGTSIAILLAPESGEKTRSSIAGKIHGAGAEGHGRTSSRAPDASGSGSTNSRRDASGNFFAQGAVASSISGSGALLSGVARKVRAGDLIAIEYQDRKARSKIVWVRDSGSGQKTQAAVHKIESEECPWKNLLKQAPSAQFGPSKLVK